MAHDNQGNLHPLMLSELIREAQKAFAEYGDMPVWSQTQYFGYDDTFTASEPVGYPPMVGCPRELKDYASWPQGKAYIVTGSPTG